jgi:hypothetical protein
MSDDAPAPSRGGLICDVCGGPVAAADAALQKSRSINACRAAECQRLATLQSTMNPHLFKTQFAFQSGLIRQRRDQEARRRQHIQTIETTEAQENHEILQSFLEQQTETDRRSIRVLSIPSGLARLITPDQQRLQHYTRHLQDVIQQAFQHSNIEDVPSTQDRDDHEVLENTARRLHRRPDLQHISDQLCALCKGGCCPAGADHAFVSVSTIRRLLDADPALSKEATLDLYLVHVPAEAIEGGCINQTASGCALPRAIRSDVCNGYYCEPLRLFQQDMADRQPPDQVLAVQRSNTQWNRFDSVDGNRILNIVLIEEGPGQG